MGLIRGAISCVPVIGPAADAYRSASLGNRLGAAVDLCSLAMDVCSTLSGAVGVQSAIGSACVARSLNWSTAKRVAGGVTRVAKSRLKQKTKSTALKVGVAAAVAVAEGNVARELRRRVNAKRFRILSSASSALHRNAPGLTFSDSLPLRPFAGASCDDSQLHAALAMQVYAGADRRHGQLSPSGQDWYAYVGGDTYRGFWYSPGPQHLVLAERGTAIGDAHDLICDACIAIGQELAAVSSRVEASLQELKKQVFCHSPVRVTVAGHSLGGAVAVFLAGAARGSDGARLVDAAHTFNPGGLPDMTRWLTFLTSSASVVRVHRIQGDLISVGFLPMTQRSYARRPGFESVNSHSLSHFLNDDPNERWRSRTTT
eukprot:TRINITY_DN95098_c0_g1_i1.p1 TRINITY_DN95098_c0_g1~~TRINITY_DN95098_c0_g1_i1.p1  ORF type:complete len:372 (-),score=63.45 TRINITY_DN95098_c0_g1_i1:116-1231(-)